ARRAHEATEDDARAGHRVERDERAVGLALGARLGLVERRRALDAEPRGCELARHRFPQRALEQPRVAGGGVERRDEPVRRSNEYTHRATLLTRLTLGRHPSGADESFGSKLVTHPD